MREAAKIGRRRRFEVAPDRRFDLPENGHRGWLADTTGSPLLSGYYQTESGTSPNTGYTCWYLPVWCCSTKPFF